MTVQRRLIVGSAGSTSAFGVIRSVRERYRNSVFVIAIDINPPELVAATVVADAFVQVPLARAPEFLGALQNLARSYAPATYLPLHDEEILAAAHFVELGTFPIGLNLVAPSYDVAQLCWDKWETHQWLAAHRFLSPHTALADPAALESMQKPAILKPRVGTAGGRFPQIRLPSQLEDVQRDSWVLQEVLQPPEVGIEAFLARNSEFFCCVAREYKERRPGGPSTKVRLHADPCLAVMAKRLAQELPFRGAFNFEVMRDSHGEWRIIDINPRVGAGTRMCTAIGIDIAGANLADFWGEDVSGLLPPLSGEYYIARQYEDYVTTRPRSTPPGSGA